MPGRRDGGAIYHLALRDEWLRAVDAGEDYRGSTLGRSLDDVGFIHCSFADQVQQIADLVYAGRRDVVLLVIDPSTLPFEIRVENLDGGDRPFPHIYGPLPTAVVVEAREVSVDAAGRLEVDALL